MLKIHTFSETLPAREKFDLYAQIRRSSKGVTGNIGEAYGRYHYLDSLHYYSIARGELMETLARLIDARVLNYVAQPEFEELYNLIRQTEQALNGFMSYIRRQRAGSGDKKLSEDIAEYEADLILNDEEEGKTINL